MHTPLTGYSAIPGLACAPSAAKVAAPILLPWQSRSKVITPFGRYGQFEN